MSVKIKEYPKKLFEEDSLLFFGADKPDQDDIDVFKDSRTFEMLGSEIEIKRMGNA